MNHDNDEENVPGNGSTGQNYSDEGGNEKNDDDHFKGDKKSNGVQEKSSSSSDPVSV